MTSRPTPLQALLLALACAASIPAQTTPELIGITAATPLLRSRDMGSCAERACAPVGFPPMASHPAAGGSAYDPTRGGVWISDGTMIACSDPDDCRYLCPPLPLPLPRAFVSGLAVNEIRGRLVVSDTASMIHVYPLSCPLGAPLFSCPASVPSGHTIGGIATADVLDLVIWSSSDFSGAAPPGNLLYVAPFGRPCSPICSTPLPRCGGVAMGPIHGVAYDQCTRTVWVTDGFKTLGLTLDPSTCALTPTHCCPAGGTEPFIGLCVMPSRGTVVGRACLHPACGPCTPTTGIGTVGDPAIGNPAFTVTLDGAPLGVPSWLMLSLGGPCSSAGTRPPAPWCGLLHIDLVLPPILVGPVTTTGSSTCGGSASTTIPIPASLSLCGLHGCAQWIGICRGGSGGLLSPALSFAISGT